MEGELARIKKWNIIYPVYINSKKTIAEGCRISASKACENPTCIEISDCCSHLKIPHAVEVISRFFYFIFMFEVYYASQSPSGTVGDTCNLVF
jgi:SRP19 protein